MRNSDNSLIIRSLRFLKQIESNSLGETQLLLTYLHFNPRSLTTIQDAKRMSIKIHFTGYRTAHLQITTG